MRIEEFFERYFEKGLPASLRCGGKPVVDFGPLSRAPEGDGRSFRLFTREARLQNVSADGTQSLRVLLKIRLFENAVEWWLELSADGDFDSPIVDGIQYADVTMTPTAAFHPSAWRYPLFHWAHGSLAQEDDFEPVRQNFCPEGKHVLSCGGGRTSSGVLPYFNLQLQEDTGAVFAIGWNGQWRATFEKLNDGKRSVRFTAEMDDARFRVRAGETLTLPKTVALPWEGRVEDSFNLWRRFMKRDVLPRYDGEPLTGEITLRAWGGLPPEIHRAKLENVKKHGLGAELYQIDAGWHGDETTPESKENYFDLWARTVGIWKPLPALYPEGFGRMNRDCRAAGMGFAVWFEPERMPSWNKAVREHPDYFIGPKLPGDEAGGEDCAHYFMMLDLGYEPARKWITDTLSEVIEDAGMAVFRIDFNFEPLAFWRYHDAPDRKGVTEIKYVNGVYAMLDELLRRHPGLKIDNCASGGRRLDYRMFRRSVPMICRSDYFCAQDNDPDPKQAHTYGLSFWTPAHADSLGSCIGHTPEAMDTYRVRSTMSSGIGMTAPWWELSEEEAAWYRKMLCEAKLVRAYMSEDFYPLTGYSLSPLDWMAFQLHRPEDGSGMVMAFRRAENATGEMTFGLRAVEKEARYRLRDADQGDLGEIAGEDLARLSVKIAEPRSSRILFYEKIR